MRRPERIAAALAAVGLSLLLAGACSGDEDGAAPDDSGGSGEQAGDSSGFCAVVEEQLPTATGEDLQAAVPAIEAMADAAPAELQDAFEENLAALAPVADAATPEAASQAFVDEVVTDPAYTDSFDELAAGVQDRCDIDVSAEQ